MRHLLRLFLLSFAVWFSALDVQATSISLPPTGDKNNVLAAATDRLPTTLRAQQPDFTFNYTIFPPVSSYASFSPLPDACASAAVADCPSTNTTAYYVTYADCPSSPWVLCHCTDAQVTVDDAVSSLGAVPVGLRRFVGTVLVMPDLSGDDPHAYTLADVGEVHIFGECNQRTWVHESTHAYDYALGVAATQSGSDGWAEAIANDTCVPDGYALTNYVEDFAQMSVLKTYQVQNGRLPTGFSADCMAHQLAFMGSLATYNATTLFGNTCSIANDDGARHSPAIEPKTVTHTSNDGHSLLSMSMPAISSALALAFSWL